MSIRHDTLAKWTKSSYSAVNGDCVEVKADGHCAVAVRDSKDPHSEVLGFRPGTWSTFIADVGRISHHV
jgi:hypothetical protein